MEEPILDYNPQPNAPKDQVASLAEAIKAKYPAPNQGSRGTAAGGQSSTSAFEAPLDLASSNQKNPIAFEDYSVDQSEIYKQISDGSYEALYKNYITGTDNGERLARQQSTGEKWANGAYKFLGKTSTAVLGGTVGSVAGLGELISTGSLEAMYNNDFNEWLDTLNEKMDYRLPNYYTAQEQDENFLQSLNNANFWANDVLGGLSFTVGAIVSEGIWAAATGGASLASSGARVGARMGIKGFKTAADLAKANTLAAKSSKQLLRSSQFGAKNAVRVGQGIQGLNTARFIYTSAGFEAGVEARSYMREAREEFLHTFEQQNGRQPSPEELASFELDLVNSANTVFTANTVLVGSSNLAVFGRMFDLPDPLSPLTKGLNKSLFGIGHKSTTVEGKKVLQALNPSKMQKITGTAYGILKTPVIEGFWEEGMQSVTNNSAMSWIESTYDQESLNENLGIMESVYEGFSETYGTKEGWKEIGIGMIIGLIGGGISGNLNDVNRARKQYKSQLDEVNTFSAENTLESFKVQNQINKAHKDIKEAESKSDLLGKDLATKRLLYTNARANARFGRSEAAEDFKASMEGLDNSYFEEIGLDPQSETFEQEKEELKNGLYEQYKEVQNQYKTNRKTAEYLVGRGNIVGVEDTETLLEAVAYNITMGENADQFSEQVFNAIKEQMTGEMGRKIVRGKEVTTTLENAHKRTRERFYYHRKNAKKSERDLENAIEALKKLETRSKETDANLASKIQEAQANIEKFTQQMETEKKLMNETFTMAQAERKQGSKIENQEIFLEEDLMEVEEHLRQGEEYLENLRETNPAKFQTLKKLFEEHRKANYAFRQFNDTVQGLANDSLKIKELNDFISKKVYKGKEANEFTKEWFTNNLKAYKEGFGDTIETYKQAQRMDQINRRKAIEEKLKTNAPLTESEQELYEMFKKEIDTAVKAQKVADTLMEKGELTEKEDQDFYAENKDVVDNIIQKAEAGDTITPKDKKEDIPKPKTLRQRVQQAIDNNTAVKSYVGEDVDSVVNEKPTQEEADEFANLDSRKKATQTGRGRRPDKNVEPLNEEETKRHEDLLNKLAFWRIVNGSVDPRGVTMADMIRAMEQEEAEPKMENIKGEISEEEMVKLEVVSDKDASRTKVDINYIQTYENVKVKFDKTKNKFVFSHLNVATILGNYGMDQIRYKAPKGAEYQPLDPERLNEYGKKEGSQFEITLADGSKVNITLGEKGRIEIAEEDFRNIQGKTGLRILNTNLAKNTYFDVYQEREINGEKRFVPMKSEFKLLTKTGEENLLEPQELEKLKEGDELTFRVNTQSIFNFDLMEEYSKAKGDKKKKILEEIENNLEIYVRTKSGRVVGVVKAIPVDNKGKRKVSATSQSQLNHLALRQEAAREFVESPLKNIDLEATIPVTTVLLGTPNLELKEEGDGLTPQNIDFTDRSLEQVQDYGYMEEGQFFTRGGTDISGVIVSAVRRISNPNKEKIPFVIFTNGNKKIAYPVSLISQKSNALNEMTEAMENANDVGEATVAINDVLLNNGIKPSKYNLMNTANEAEFTQTLQEIQTDLENLESKPDLESWVEKGSNKSVLKTEARISIDLTNRPLKSPKLLVDFSKVNVAPPGTNQQQAGAVIDVPNQNQVNNQINNC